MYEALSKGKSSHEILQNSCDISSSVLKFLYSLSNNIVSDKFFIVFLDFALEIIRASQTIYQMLYYSIFHMH